MNTRAAQERQRLLDRVHEFGAAMRRSKAHAMAPWMDIDLSIPQLRVLCVLAGSEPMSMSALAQTLGITMSACTHLVDRLVGAGLVVRGEDSADRRVVRCMLTNEGGALVERVNQSVPFERPEFLEKLSLDELRVIVNAMEITRRVMDEVRAERGTTQEAGGA